MNQFLRPVAFTGLLCFAGGASSQGPSPALVGYWHNWNDASAPYIELDQIDARYNVIEVAFAEPAAGTTYDMQFTPALTPQSAFIDQVEAHQAAGRKVLISIGGANATVQLNSDAERDQFTASMLTILTTYGFNGMDIDLEGSSVTIAGGTIVNPVDETVLRLIDAVEGIMAQYRTMTGEKLFLTMAPETAYVQGGQSAYGGIWGAYLPIIHALRDSLDILQVQLYNSGSMFGIDGGIYEPATADFIISQTEAVIQGFNTGGGSFAGLPPEKVALALPACGSAAGGGYTDTTVVRAAMEYLLGEGPQPGTYALQQPGGYPGLRGMMTWSINWDAVAACDGAYSYAENFERIFNDLPTSIPTGPSATIVPFPNPTNAYLELRGCTPIAIAAPDGRVVKQFSDTRSSGTLDVRDLMPGAYALLARANDRLVVLRFVKE